MTRWIVWRSSRFAYCWECDGGGNADMWQVYAESATEALHLVKDSIRLESWDQPAELHCLAVAPSKAQKARILRQSEWMADQSAVIDPPEPSWAGAS